MHEKELKSIEKFFIWVGFCVANGTMPKFEIEEEDKIDDYSGKIEEIGEVDFLF